MPDLNQFIQWCIETCNKDNVGYSQAYRNQQTVNGITLDFDKDGTYWAFYVDGKYGEKGVDQTEINENSVYSFKPEK